MADENYAGETKSNTQAHHLTLPEHNTQHHSTIYKLTLSMKRRFSPLVNAQTPSPEGAGEVRDLLQRLVEIDNESRELLVKVFSLLEKDEALEKYVKKRIEDPKVSRMWELVEQVLACQEQDTNLDELIMGEDDTSNYSTFNKSIKEKNELEEDEKKKIERFKVRNILSGKGPGGSIITTNSTTDTKP